MAPKLSVADKKIIDRIERLRRRNNQHWVGIVRLVMRVARKDARKIFAKIEENDRKIYQATRKLAR